jgi:S-DNA-T family DNA segregation ATPase FtsK/SpoIIIE
METVIILRKIMNPLHYLKKIPMTINVGGGDSEQTDNSRDNMDTNRVYDNPETEEVIFDLGNDQKEDDETDNIVDDSYEEPDETTQKTDDTEFVIEETEEEESADGKNVAGNYGDISTPYDP